MYYYYNLFLKRIGSWSFLVSPVRLNLELSMIFFLNFAPKRIICIRFLLSFRSNIFTRLVSVWWFVFTSNHFLPWWREQQRYLKNTRYMQTTIIARKGEHNKNNQCNDWGRFDGFFFLSMKSNLVSAIKPKVI